MHECPSNAAPKEPEEPTLQNEQQSEDCPPSSGAPGLEVSGKTQQTQQAHVMEENFSVCSPAVLPDLISDSEDVFRAKNFKNNDSMLSAGSGSPAATEHASGSARASPRSSVSTEDSQEPKSVATRIKGSIGSVGRASMKVLNSQSTAMWSPNNQRSSNQRGSNHQSRLKSLRHMSTRSLGFRFMASTHTSASVPSMKDPKTMRRHATQDLSFDDVVKAHKHMLTDQARLGVFCMLMPGTKVITVWTSLMLIVVLIAVVTAPVELGFQWWSTPLWWQVLIKVVDFFCISDMFLNFNVAFFSHGRLVTSRRKVAKKYLKSWFLLDALSNTPWDWFLSGKSAKGRKLVKLLKLPKVFRVARLLRMVREQAHYVGTALILVAMLIMGHYISCLWAFVLIDCDFQSPEAGIHVAACPSVWRAYLEGLSVGMATLGGSDAWLRFHHALAVTEGQGSAFTWTTPPGATTELVSVATCLVGLCALALLFGSISQAFQKVSQNNRLFHDRLANLRAASKLGQHKVQKDIYGRTRKHYHYIWNCGSDATRAILHDRALSVDLRRQLAFCFYGEYLKRVPFLASGEETFLMQLCERVEVQYFSPMDVLIRAGELGDELYFLAVGSVEVFSPGISTPIKTLEEGSFFGELGLLFPEMKRTASIIGTTFGCVLTARRETFQEICSDEMMEIFRSIATSRNGEESVNATSYRPISGGGDRTASKGCLLNGSRLRQPWSDSLPRRMMQEPNVEEIFCQVSEQLEQTMFEWRQPFHRQINELNEKITLLTDKITLLQARPAAKSAGRTSKKWWSPRSSLQSVDVSNTQSEAFTEIGLGPPPHRSMRRVQSVS